MKNLARYFPLLLILIAFTIYSGSINNEFLVIDDYDGFVHNETIKSLSSSIKTLDFNNFLYALSYKFFGINAVPLHIMSISFHAINAILGFLVIKELFNFKTAAVASILFLVHPVNTEAVTWISGRVYLYIAFFSLAVLLPFIKYRKTKKLGFLFLSAEIYFVSLFIYRNIWLMLIPVLVLVVDRFFIEKKPSLKNLSPIGLIFGIAFSFLLISGAFIIEHTVDFRIQKTGDNGFTSSYGNNQEALIPVLESYPYTTYSMVRLFAFPKTLTFYNNGNPVEGVEYGFMFLVFASYIGLTIYAFKKDKKIFGILVLMPLLIAPSYSPIKVTWYITERYLYLSSLFFSLLVALLYSKAEKQFNSSKVIKGGLVVLLLVLSARTTVRIEDWQNIETLSAANIKTAPYTERPYNDLGAFYLLEGNVDKSLDNYNKALSINRQSESAINTIGLIMLNYGPPYLEKQREISRKEYEVEITENTGEIYFRINNDIRALFFLNENLIYKAGDSETLSRIEKIYRKNGYAEFADEVSSIY